VEGQRAFEPLAQHLADLEADILAEKRLLQVAHLGQDGPSHVEVNLVHKLMRVVFVYDDRVCRLEAVQGASDLNWAVFLRDREGLADDILENMLHDHVI